MDFFKLIEERRSIRKFGSRPTPHSVVQKALEAAVLAPNSSNMQTWDFYWFHSHQLRELADACMDQSAAVTASHLIVIAANSKRWRRSYQRLLEFNKLTNVPKSVDSYYTKIIPRVYSYHFFNLHLPLKRLLVWLIGLARPIPRRPFSRRELEELCVKSAALAAENFVLAVAYQGYGTCMMEGFDERRIQKLLGLTRSDRVVMVIAVGEIDPQNSPGPRFRLPASEVIHKINHC